MYITAKKLKIKEERVKRIKRMPDARQQRQTAMLIKKMYKCLSELPILI
jgi:hypothetical protein